MPSFSVSEMGVYDRMIDSRVVGSVALIMKCWPMGRPSFCCSCSSLRVKMRVSQETFLIAERVALVHERGWRNVGRVSEDSSWGTVFFRAARSVGLSVPMW